MQANIFQLLKNSKGLIAGPCSVESEDQLRQSVVPIIQSGVSIIRAGIWKPRTRPNNFEGLGEKALPWLQRLKQEFEIDLAIEVASAQHVELALSYGIDIVWIGARTTVNPFTVDEIANALKGLNIPVLIKNPINADAALWMGAIERFLNYEVNNLGLIHRGFSTYKTGKYRNLPQWQIALDVKSKFPELPLICDPSHIAGNKKYLREIAQKAFDLNYDGLMIESHFNPEIALSDKEQQVTPKELFHLLESLTSRNPSFQDQFKTEQLEELRDKIDHLDEEIIESIAARLQLVDQIGHYKKENNVSIFQLERLKEILTSRKKWSKTLGVSNAFIESLFKLIHHHSIKRQNEIFKDKT